MRRQLHVLVAGSLLCPVLSVARPALAQPALAQPALAPPRTAEGRPDLQGFWYFGTATPLERPREFADKVFLTPEEAADFERRTAERQSAAIAVQPSEWLDYGKHVGPDRRTSLIVDPPDGRMPPLTEEGRRKAAMRRAIGPELADNPEDRSNTERCLVFGAGPPLTPGPYNNNLQIVQTPAAIVVMTEMIHDARIVPLDGRPRLPAGIRRWLGASRGHWQGDTLVVETTNFTESTTVRGSDENLRVVERFTLAGPDAMRYEYTIDNPAVFTRPWTAAFTLTRTAEPMFEFACHEGNQAMEHIMRGARQQERTASPQPR